VSLSSLKRSVKSAAVHSFHVSGAARAAPRMLGVKGAILLFHEIQDDANTELDTGCSAAFFEQCIRWLRSAGWEIVTLTDAIERLNRDAPGRNFVVVSFDDGYRDNISRALPILRREQAPFTVYVPTGAITRELFAWWLGLREIFRINDSVEIAPMGRSFSCTDLMSKARGLSVVTHWVHEDYKRISDLRDAFSTYGISLRALCERYFMNADELRLLAREPLASIGAHTVTHPALSVLDAASARREMIENRNYLQECLDADVFDFAYPYGNRLACGAREAALAAEAGFRTAATTCCRPLFAEDCHDLFSLPRLSVLSHWDLGYVNAAIGGLTIPTVRQLALNHH
jgi:peptidoglycan/xylan/chitin deacetylase (PgdA/CDA1 family)